MHYILSFCPSFSPTFSPLPLPSYRRISLFHSSPCSFSFPVQGDTHARTLSPSVSLFLSSPAFLFPFSFAASLSLLVRLHRFAHLVTRSNMRLTVVVAEIRVRDGLSLDAPSRAVMKSWPICQCSRLSPLGSAPERCARSREPCELFFDNFEEIKGYNDSQPPLMSFMSNEIRFNFIWIQIILYNMIH